MKILIIGGTRFVGRHIVESALKAGHIVTLFNRGHEDPDLFHKVQRIKGDRYFDLDQLKGMEWDVVIDTCGYEPKAVRLSAEFLKNVVGKYIYISSGSVYEDWENGKLDESSAIKTLTKEAAVEVEKILESESPSSASLLKYYGELKAACEKQLEAIMPGRVLHVRSGIIVGPWDYSGRFPYWIRRIARGGRVLSPDRAEAPIRFLDARDLADWIIHCMEQNTTGVFNTWGPGSMTFGQVLSACQPSDKDSAEFVWVTEEKLLAHDVQPWSDLPLWLPSEYKAYFEATDEKAILRGMTYRPIQETINDTSLWLKEQKPQFTDSEGLPSEREVELLKHHL